MKNSTSKHEGINYSVTPSDREELVPVQQIKSWLISNPSIPVLYTWLNGASFNNLSMKHPRVAGKIFVSLANVEEFLHAVDVYLQNKGVKA